MHDEHFGASGILINSLDACCVDVRLPVARHIVVTGGGSEIPGLGAAICAHASYLLTQQQRGRVVMSTLSSDNAMVDTMHKLENHRLRAHQSMFNGSLMSWIGGSLFSSLAVSDFDSCILLYALHFTADDDNDGMLCSRAIAQHTCR